MLRTEGGAAVRVPASRAERVSRTVTRQRDRLPSSLRSVVGRGGTRGARGAGDDASGSDSDAGFEDELQPPHAERFRPRPVDQVSGIADRG